MPAEDLDRILESTRDIWKDLRGAHLLVTGGTGFFGRWMLESFMHANHSLGLDTRATALSRDVAAYRGVCPHIAQDSAIELVQADIRHVELPNKPFTHVLHMAAETNRDMTCPPARVYHDVIVGGTEKLVDMAVACGAQRMLLVGSGAAYGRQPEDCDRLAEDIPSAPLTDDLNSAYGQTKRYAEFMSFAKAEGLELGISSARCFAFVGPGLQLDSGLAVGNFIAEALDAGRITIRGDGTPVRSYMYAGDLAIWLWTILVNGTRERSYNVGSDQPISIAEVADVIAGLVAPRAEVEVLCRNDCPGVGDRYVPSIDRARAELGLSMTYGLEDALARTIHWHQRRADP